jgi:hypothetical protein
VPGSRSQVRGPRFEGPLASRVRRYSPVARDGGSPSIPAFRFAVTTIFPRILAIWRASSNKRIPCDRRPCARAMHARSQRADSFALRSATSLNRINSLRVDAPRASSVGPNRSRGPEQLVDQMLCPGPLRDLLHKRAHIAKEPERTLIDAIWIIGLHEPHISHTACRRETRDNAADPRRTLAIALKSCDPAEPHRST